MTSEENLRDILLRCRLTMSAAESCTGGLVSAALTSLPGSSAFFKGGIVAYDNSIKQKLLGVPEEILNSFGAVSSQTVERMASGVASLINSDCAVSVSGIAGPGGGSPEKPVGLVYIGSFAFSEVTSCRYVFSGNRHEIRAQAVEAALNQLITQLS
ncbi:damage-inducible protein CinA [Chitinispirillum alkaliphilum]|nr:damage-inducible protein CinA [Chitinispirillum alkaliphilum]